MVIMIDTFRQKKYYPQALLEECNYDTKITKMENLINDELESSLSDDETDGEAEADDESNNESDKV